MRTQAEIKTILNDVQARLDSKAKAAGFQLQIPPDGYLQEEEWLNVIVTPVSQGLRACQYVDALKAIEQDLRDSGVAHVLLVPALLD